MKSFFYFTLCAAFSLLLLASLVGSYSINDTLPWTDIQYMFVFGDSYSSVGYNVSGEHPSPANPIGNPEFPGNTTSYGPNWVGWLTTAYNESILFAYDFAVSGSVTQDAVNQIRTEFIPYFGHGPPWAPWGYNTSLFVTWIGNNDVFRDQYNIDSQLQLLFRWQEVLYDWGATNFLFVNVNPYDRSPSASSSNSDLGERIAYWNAQLPTYVTNFTYIHSGVTASLYDVNTIFQTVLDNPTKYGFKDNKSMCGDSTCIWADDVHATYAMQKIIAANMAQLLGNSKATGTNGNGTSGGKTSAGTKHSPSFAVVALILPFILFFVNL